MAAAQEGHESLRERARRALLDNPEIPLQPQASLVPAQPAAEPGSHTEQIELRLQAIRVVRDLEPRRTCFAERVRDLTRSLVELPFDSVHYGAVLEKLQEAHVELRTLDEKLWAATYMIRSTQWLVDLLADPAAPGGREVAAAGEA